MSATVNETIIRPGGQVIPLVTEFPTAVEAIIRARRIFSAHQYDDKGPGSHGNTVELKVVSPTRTITLIG